MVDAEMRNDRSEAKQPEDFGFGKTLTSAEGHRLVNRDGSFNVLRNRARLTDWFSYATLLNISWPKFILWVVGTFFAVNLIFGAAYALCGSGALVQAGPPLGVGALWRSFIFSVDTFSTIGYGNLVPVGHFANVLVALEAVLALLNAALVTGLVFARFSKPDVRIEFSNLGVVRFSKTPALLIRLRNVTRNEVLELEATLLAWFRHPDDHRLRSFYSLPLERSRITFLPLSWTVAHFITPESPLNGLTREQFQQSIGELMLQIRGVDQNGAQVIYARVSYTADEIAWGAQFVDHYTHDSKTGAIGIDPHRFHEITYE